jgi:hypothetical protein
MTTTSWRILPEQNSTAQSDSEITLIPPHRPAKSALALFPCLHNLIAVTVIESIVRGIQGLPLRQQIEVARHVYRLNSAAQQERAEVLRRTHGRLDENDGQAFEDALADARRIEAHG